jgi:hypothetical protein
VTLPVVLLLIDYFKERRAKSEERRNKTEFSNFQIFKFSNLLEKLPFFILALIFGIITFISQKAFDTSTYDMNLININIIDRFFMLTYSIAFYIVKLFIPVNLSAIYSYPSKTGGFLPMLYYLSPLLIIGLLFLLKKSEKRKAKSEQETSKTIIFGTLFYFITVSVVLMLIHVGHAIVAERYSYVPYLGFFIIFGSIYNNLKMCKSNNITTHFHIFTFSHFKIFVYFFLS